MSISAAILRVLFRLIGLNSWIYRAFLKPGRETGRLSGARFPDDLKLVSWEVSGHKLLSILQPDPSAIHLVFLPGGAYLMEPTFFHTWFLKKLILKFQLSATYIDYPKAPEHTFRTTHEVVLEAYQAITRRYPAAEFVLLGDSAGGGLALALAQVLRDQRIQPYPAKIVLISPWIDLTLSRAAIPHDKARDLLLPRHGLMHAAEQYAGGEDLRDPLLSPLYGDLSNLGPILLLYGTNELFFPDFKELTARLAASPGSSLEYILGKGLIHDWILFPISESRQGILTIGRFILSGPAPSQA